jgi:hypothetical protein
MADHDLGAHVTQSLRPFIVISHHRENGVALLKQQSSNSPSNGADASCSQEVE